MFGEVLVMDNIDDFSIKYELTVKETNIIIAALEEIPAKLCNPIVNKLRQQADPQLQKLNEEDVK